MRRNTKLIIDLPNEIKKILYKIAKKTHRTPSQYATMAIEEQAKIDEAINRDFEDRLKKPVKKSTYYPCGHNKK